MRTIEEVVDEIEDIEIGDIDFNRSMAVARQLDEILEIHRAEKSDYDKIQKISLDLAFENDELMNKSRWIPTTERLPEKNVEILATTEWGAVTIAEMYSANDWFIHEGTTNADTDEIVAWMPLPEAYKAERGE